MDLGSSGQLRVLRRSLQLHARWVAQAVRPGAQTAAPLNIRRGALLMAGLPPYAVVQALHWLGFGMDELMFRRYRDTSVDDALFITGIPRSGTTFLHRILALDSERYTTMTMWEALLAPSITERKLWHGLGRIDQALGGWGARALNALTERLGEGLADIHEVRLDAPEEDYLALLPAAACFLAVLAVPYSRCLWQLAAFDRDMPKADRDALIDFYHGVLQRHCHADDRHRRLLSKNAAFGSWVKSLAERFPRSRFIVCVREPVEALASQLSAVEGARKLMGAESSALAAGFEQAFTANYEHLRLMADHLGPQRLAVIDLQDLRTRPGERLREVFLQLNLPISDGTAAALAQADLEACKHRSTHRYSPSAFGLVPERIRAAMDPAYHALIRRPTMSRAL